MPQPYRRRVPVRAGGFTLIELLIALAMMGLVTLLLFSGLRLGSRAWEAVEATAERTSVVRLAHSFLSRTLVQARAATVLYDGATIPVFSGDSARLELAAPLSEHVGIPGIYILRIALEGSGARRRLVLTHWLMHPDVLEGLDDAPEWRPLAEDAEHGLDSLPLNRDAAAGAFGRTPILGGVAELAIDYFGTLEGDTEPDWHAEWLEQDRLPALVRIRLVTPERTWPDLVVAMPDQRT